MESYIQFFSTLQNDGKKHLVDIIKWAEMTLNEEEALQCKEFFVNLIAEITSLPGTEVEDIYSSVDHPGYPGQKIAIAKRWKFADIKPPLGDFDYWENRFASDPNVTHRALLKEQ